MAEDCMSIGGGCCILTFIFFILLIACSFSSVGINEYGLDYSSISKHVNKKIYTAGLHWLGIGHSFILFPRTVQTIEFSKDASANGDVIRSRTFDGLEVTLEISFQYKLDYEQIYELYRALGQDYERVLELSSIHILTDDTTNYTAYKFFTDRQKIGIEMQNHLNQYFFQNCFSTIDFFQLRSGLIINGINKPFFVVDLPDEFEDAIQLSEVKKQDILKAEAEKNKTEVTIQTKIISAFMNMNSTINLAMGDAQAIIEQADAFADSFLVVQNANSKAYKKLKTQLNLDSPSLSKLVRNYNGTNIIIGMDKIE